MTVLNFPVINQKTTITSDGKPDVNALWDCVPECDAGILEYFTGKHFEGGVLKEAVYGATYRGGTDEHAYVQLMAHYGVRVYPIDGNPQALVILAHGHIKAGHPVLMTEPDPYMPAGSGYTHVVVIFEEHPGGVTIMDPYIAQSVTLTDAELAAHIAVKEVWIAQKIQENEIVSISLTTPGVSNWFKAGSGNAWVCTKNGCIIHDGMLNFYRTMSGSLAGLTMAGLPENNEHKPLKPSGMSDQDYQLLLRSHGEISEQDFERLTLRYDPNHVMDNPPGGGPVYVVHRETVDTSAQEALQEQLSAAAAAVASLQAKVQQAKDALQAVLAKL